MLHEDSALWNAACGSRDAAGDVRRLHPEDAWIAARSNAHTISDHT